MLIGLGGGAASSVAGGDSSEELDFASVQRDNAEMERRCQEVIDRCCALGDGNPIVTIHDVGAGGLSNAIPGNSARFRCRRTHRVAQDSVRRAALSPMQIWCNEAQERYVLGLRPADVARFEAICARERCPCAIVGEVSAERRLVVDDSAQPSAPDSHCAQPIDLPMDVLFGKTPKMQRDSERKSPRMDIVPDLDGIVLEEAIRRVLRLPAVGSKSFLVTIGDRTVGGLCARDPMVGPWQVPVADCAVTLTDFDGYAGEAMAMGERTPVAVLSAPASARHGGRRGDHQSRRGADRGHRRDQAVGELDGRGRRTRRGRRAVRRGAGGRQQLCPAIEHFDSGRQGFAVDAGGLAARRAQAQDGVAGVADRQRFRARRPTCARR